MSILILLCVTVQIGEAYRIATQSKGQTPMEEFWAWYEQQLNEMEELEKYRHKAPQHRQYLEFNAGQGSVSQRQKQSQQRRCGQFGLLVSAWEMCGCASCGDSFFSPPPVRLRPGCGFGVRVRSQQSRYGMFDSGSV